MWPSSHPHIGFLAFAEEFASAARHVKSNSGGPGAPLSLVGYFLLGHATELALKSFLIKSGYSQNQLRAIGHDLRAGLDEVRSNGINPALLLPDLVGSIDLLNEYYSSKELEYFFGPMGLRLPEADRLERGVNHLLEGLKALYRETLRVELSGNGT